MNGNCCRGERSGSYAAGGSADAFERYILREFGGTAYGIDGLRQAIYTHSMHALPSQMRITLAMPHFRVFDGDL